ncbi:MAG: hypothetical protein IJ853_04385, partial [Rickettsiales bacterium]|nr:hypothetical protein [Rickettsiales bacterium]
MDNNVNNKNKYFISKTLMTLTLFFVDVSAPVANKTVNVKFSSFGQAYASNRDSNMEIKNEQEFNNNNVNNPEYKPTNIKIFGNLPKLEENNFVDFISQFDKLEADEKLNNNNYLNGNMINENNINLFKAIKKTSNIINNNIFSSNDNINNNENNLKRSYEPTNTNFVINMPDVTKNFEDMVKFVSAKGKLNNNINPSPNNNLPQNNREDLSNIINDINDINNLLDQENEIDNGNINNEINKLPKILGQIVEADEKEENLADSNNNVFGSKNNVNNPKGSMLNSITGSKKPNMLHSQNLINNNQLSASTPLNTNPLLESASLIKNLNNQNNDSKNNIKIEEEKEIKEEKKDEIKEE